MQVKYHDVPDDLKEQIANQLEIIAKYDQGDIVTVEPLETEFGYAGDYLEGVPLVVNGIEAYRTDISTMSWELAEYYIDRGHFTWDNIFDVESRDQFDEVIVADDISYSFQRVKTYMGETSLIDWDEYREKYADDGHVKFPREKGSGYATKRGNQECKVCGSEWFNVSQMESPPGDVQENCSVCGFDPRHESFNAKWS